MNLPKGKAWVISVNMGYGHERAAYALRHMAHKGIIVANDYPGIPSSDKNLWTKNRKIYEAISRLKPIPFLGEAAFGLMDRIQKIDSFYPRRDLSRPTMQLKQAYGLVSKFGWGKHLIMELAKKPLPIIATFPMPAFVAEYWDYPGDIYCTVTDTDMNRAWVALDPKRSRIKYFAPTGRVVERLKLYGVREENIFFTGFPLPKEIVGGPRAEIAKADISARLCNLDPNQTFFNRYEKTLHEFLPSHHCTRKPSHPLTLTFTVGGAGAQTDIGVQMVKSLAEKIGQHRIKVNLVAGSRKDVAAAFLKAIRGAGIGKELGKWVNINLWKNRADYFKEFTKMLRTTDILWTKPSEMSFYTGIGLPIIMAPPVGSQEDFNKIWLKVVGGGVSQNNPKYTNEWLFDWVENGAFARMAWSGFIEAPTHGAFRIEQIITGKPYALEPLPLVI